MFCMLFNVLSILIFDIRRYEMIIRLELGYVYIHKGQHHPEHMLAIQLVLTVFVRNDNEHPCTHCTQSHEVVFAQ